MKQESEKLQYISVLRVSSMLLIVLFHSMCFYTGAWWFICSDVVPLWRLVSFPIVKIGLTTFVFISGFLYGYMYIERGKYRNERIFMVNKVRRLLIPYFIWGIFMISLIPIVNIPWINLFTGVAHLWFLLMLFEIFFFVMLLNRFEVGRSNSSNIRTIDCVILVISFSLLYIWDCFSTHHYALAIRETLYYLPTFLFGVFCAKYRLVNYRKNIALFSLFIGVVTLFLFSFLGYTDNSTLYRIPAIVISTSAMVLVKDSSVSICNSSIFNNLDKNCMGIYIFNQIVILEILQISEVYSFLISHSYWGVLLLFILSLIIPWLLSNLFNKNKLLSFLIGGIS